MSRAHVWISKAEDPGRGIWSEEGACWAHRHKRRRPLIGRQVILGRFTVLAHPKCRQRGQAMLCTSHWHQVCEARRATACDPAARPRRPGTRSPAGLLAGTRVHACLVAVIACKPGNGVLGVRGCATKHASCNIAQQGDSRANRTDEGRSYRKTNRSSGKSRKTQGTLLW